MNPETALILRDDARAQITFTPEALLLKESALSQAALIGKVTNSTEQEIAVAAQTDLHRIVADVEKARKECKEPVIEFGRRIDNAAKNFIEEVKDEELRVARLVGDYVQIEQARIRAEEQLRLKELQEIERAKAQAILDAAKTAPLTHDKLDAIQEHFNQKAADLPVPVMEKAKGQTAVEDWELTITDPALLFRAHPNCVKLVPIVTEIKMLLKAGFKPAGVTAVPIVRAGVRLGAQRKAIEV